MRSSGLQAPRLWPALAVRCDQPCAVPLQGTGSAPPSPALRTHPTPLILPSLICFPAAAKINAATIVATAAADGQTLVTTLKEAGVAPGWALQIMLAARAQ